MFDATRTVCPRCHRRAHRVRSASRLAAALVGAAAIAAMAASVGYIATRERPFDWGMRGPKIRYLLGELKREPCDRAKIVELGDTLNAAGDFRGALKQSYRFTEACGPLERLRWVTYSAHQRLSEHAQAAADATALIDANPDDKDYWWWRGIVFEQTGELERAAADYERAIAIQPALGSIPFNLAGIYERLGRPCDAARTVTGLLAHHPELVDHGEVTSRMDRLRRACKP
jgi:aspartyl protease family protein